MSDFRTKLLGVAAMSTLLAGMSYGQQFTISASTAVQGALNLRAEGTTELVSPLTFNIANTGAGTTGTITIFLNAPVTSALIVGGFGTTNATLNLGGNNYAGTVGGATGNQLTFSGFGGAGVQIPAGASVATVSAVRVNASAVALAATLTGVTEQAAITVNDVSTTQAAGGSVTVGYVFSTLNPLFAASGTGSGAPTPVTNYNTAQGNPSKTSLLPSFWVSAGDSVAGAFKVFGAPANYQTEDADGNASFGTRIQLVFGNVPSPVTLYVPTTITVFNTGNPTATPPVAPTSIFVLTLVTSPTAPDSATGTVPAATASTSFTAPGGGNANIAASLFAGATTYGPVAPINPSGGSAIAAYEVTQTSISSKVSAEIPVWVTFAANSVTTSSGAITVLEGYSPQAAAAAATTTPNFAPVTTGAINASSIVLAQTSLLFPFVANTLGFDTGLAISNTTTDPLGTTPVPGACSLNFYGTGAPTTSTGVAAPGGVQASGTSNAFLLSSVAPGFQGYMIAVCNYPDAHGFAYIVYGGLGTPSGVTMGYVAEILNRNPLVIPESLGE